MRSIALFLLLLGVLIYLLPFYRESLPVTIDLADADTRNTAAGVVVLGLIVLVWERF